MDTFNSNINSFHENDNVSESHFSVSPSTSSLPSNACLPDFITVEQEYTGGSPVGSPGGLGLGGGVGTMKEYEEQLAGLRKENFNLKLKIYFLEERLEATNISPHQENIIKRNIQLKMKVESLNREVMERKELLCAAARALEITEEAAAKRETELLSQLAALKKESEDGICDTERVEEDSVALYTAAFNLPTTKETKHLQVEDKHEEKMADTCSTVSLREDDCKSSDDINIKDDKAEFEKLKRENAKSLEMIQGCLKRIDKMNRADCKLRESLQRKEKRIIHLQAQLKQAGISATETTGHSEMYSEESEDNPWIHKYKEIVATKDKQINELEEKIKNINSSREEKHLNIQQMLTKRLQEMAFFLDSLLSHRCVIGEEKRRKVENFLEQSLQLPVGLELDPDASRILETSFVGDVSQSFRLEDLTKYLGHHISMDESTSSDCKLYKSDSAQYNNTNLQDIVKQQDILINKLNSQLECYRNKSDSVSPGKLSMGRKNRSKSNKSWQEEESEEWSEPDRSVSLARLGLHPSHISSNHHINLLTQQRDEALQQLEESKIKIEDLHSQIEALHENHQKDLNCKQNEIETLKTDVCSSREDLRQVNESYEMKVSQLEKEKYQLNEENVKLSHSVDELKELLGAATAVGRMDIAHRPDRGCPSPDQGIDTDRHSSLEHADNYYLQEVSSLRWKLKETEEKLQAALHQTDPLGLHSMKVERGICHQIHKTTSVLRKARKNFTS